MACRHVSVRPGRSRDDANGNVDVTVNFVFLQKSPELLQTTNAPSDHQVGAPAHLSRPSPVASPGGFSVPTFARFEAGAQLDPPRQVVQLHEARRVDRYRAALQVVAAQALR